MKKIVLNRYTVFIIILVSSFLWFTKLNNGTVKGASYYETESNNTYQTADVICDNSTILGVMNFTTDVDFYRYQIAKQGYFNIIFDNATIGAELDYGWDVVLYDTKGNVLCSYKNVKESFYTQDYAFKQGKEVYIKVTSHNTSAYSYPAVVEYSITIKFIESSDWEFEINDSADDATQLILNKALSGNLYSYYDIDYYEFVVDKEGYFCIDFETTLFGQDTLSGWNVILYDKDGNEIYASEQITKSLHTYDFAYDKGSKFYLKVEANSAYSYSCPRGINYEISVDMKTNINWESEDNNMPERADYISYDKTYYGNMMKASDVDYYNFDLRKNGVFHIDFNIASINDIGSSGDGWCIEIYYKDSKIYTGYAEKSLSSPDFSFTKDGSYYIRITAKDTSFYNDDIEGVNYKIKVDFTKSELWEKEFNNSKGNATAISENKIYSGNLYKENDVDYYKYKVTKAGTLKLYFGLSDISYDSLPVGWTIEIIKNGATISTITDMKTIYGYCKSQKVKKGDTIYIKVSVTSRYNSNNVTNVNYSVKAQMK